MKDKLKNCRNLQDFQSECHICGCKKTHLFNECDKIHFIPNKDFILKRLNYSRSQERVHFLQHERRNTRYKTLKNLNVTQYMAVKTMKTEENHSNSDASSNENSPGLPKTDFKRGSERLRTKITVNHNNLLDFRKNSLLCENEAENKEIHGGINVKNEEIHVKMINKL